MSLPDAMHDGWMARIARGAVIEFSAEIDDLHGRPFPGTQVSLQAMRGNPDPSELPHYLASCKGERLDRYQPRSVTKRRPALETEHPWQRQRQPGHVGHDH